MKKILLVAINAKYIHSNPAVYSLYAYAKEFQDNIEIAEYTINQQEADILADIYQRKPDVIAFSCYIWNMHMIEALLMDISQVLPQVDVWLGGPEVSFDAPKRLEKYPQLRGVFIGEGEATFYEVTKLYVGNDAIGEDEWEKIPGLCLQGKPARYTAVREITDINTIPFFYETLGLEEFKNRIIYYESSRGCPYRCSYCLSSIDKQVRIRSLDLVLPELQFFLDNKVPQVKFIDRTFNCNREHAMAIWNYILEHDNGVTNFHFEVAADIMTPEELEIIEKMRPGLIQLEIGVQSTNCQTIEEIHRVMDLDKVRENVAAVKSFHNTHQHLDLIAGLPFENFDSFVKSFNEVYAMKPDQLQLGFLKVLKGSYMESQAENYQMKFHREPPYEVLSTQWISYDEILQLKKIEEMVELFYNSGQFTATMKVFEAKFETPFALFASMAAFYEKMDYFVHVPARSYRYQVMYQFGEKYMPDDIDVLGQALTYDLYLRENCKSRAEFALDLNQWKEEIREQTTNKKNHIDIFSYPVWEKTSDMIFEKMDRPVFVEFDYSKRDPLSHNAMIHLL